MKNENKKVTNEKRLNNFFKLSRQFFNQTMYAK
jgi:hypothetical protein